MIKNTDKELFSGGFQPDSQEAAFSKVPVDRLHEHRLDEELITRYSLMKDLTIQTSANFEKFVS